MCAPLPHPAEYAAVQTRLQRGWGTWDTNTVTGQALLPQGVEIRFGLKRATSENSDAFLPAALIGRPAGHEERVFPGPKAYDGSYSELRLQWRGIEIELETAKAGDDLVMLVTPRSRAQSVRLPAVAVFSVGMAWNRAGSVSLNDTRVVARMRDSEISIFASGEIIDDPHVPLTTPYIAVRLEGPAGVSTGRPRDIPEISRIVANARNTWQQRTATADPAAAVRAAIESVIAWDTIYEPERRRIITPVSRVWNQNWGGYVLFEWDTFFAASLAALGNEDLAYANVIEVLNETTSTGFSPNYARAAGWKSSDRSEPPLGAITVLALYRRFHSRWLLEETYDRLLKWNLWWAASRKVDAYLVWGSDPNAKPLNPDDSSVGTLQGARYESGLDNSPMYDDVGFSSADHLMQLADVGLMSLYIADCDALAEIATESGHVEDAKALRARATVFRKGLATLWDPTSGIYRNKDLRTGKLSERLAPTSFYPLLARAPTEAQADAMIKGHLLNPREFWGDRVLPSIARNDPAFKDQDYWRGRIWGPMNYLVWLGLGRYNTAAAKTARHQLSQRSLDLFLEEWRTNGHVHENYSAIGPDHDSVANSDPFYHWGALLGLIGPEVDPHADTHNAR